MPATTALPPGAVVGDTTAPTAKVLHSAGVAAIAYAALYLVAFIANSLASTMVASYAEEYPTPAQMLDQRPYSATLAIAFVVVGILGIVALTGVATYLGRAGSVLAPGLKTITAALGAGVFGFGVAATAQRSMANDYIAGSGADAAAQSAVVQGLFVIPQTFAALFGVAFAGWLILAAAAGRRGLLPGWMRVTNVLVGVVGLLALYVGFPFGLLLSIPYFAVLGVWALRTSRSA
jgi:uncharacterized membrane protein